MEIKEDCFAYDKKNNECTALTELFCMKEKCKFYRSNKDISRNFIEFCVRNYGN